MEITRQSNQGGLLPMNFVNFQCFHSFKGPPHRTFFGADVNFPFNLGGFDFFIIGASGLGKFKNFHLFADKGKGVDYLTGKGPSSL